MGHCGPFQEVNAPNTAAVISGPDSPGSAEICPAFLMPSPGVDLIRGTSTEMCPRAYWAVPARGEGLDWLFGG